MNYVHGLNKAKYLAKKYIEAKKIDITGFEQELENLYPSVAEQLTWMDKEDRYRSFDRIYKLLNGIDKITASVPMEDPFQAEITQSYYNMRCS